MLSEHVKICLEHFENILLKFSEYSKCQFLIVLKQNLHFSILEFCKHYENVTLNVEMLKKTEKHSMNDQYNVSVLMFTKEH